MSERQLPTFQMDLAGDGAWPELKGQEEKILYTNAIRVAGLPVATTGGKPGVVFRFDLEDGRVVIAETTLRLLLTAADALRAKYGDPRR